jgi:hypothetical protein
MKMPGLIDDEPKTWFEWERRKISQPELKGGEGEISDGMPRYPALPQGNPWSEPLAPEPLIDRRCDGDTVEHEGD